MAARKGGLGRGLDSMIPNKKEQAKEKESSSTTEQSNQTASEVKEVVVEKKEEKKEENKDTIDKEETAVKGAVQIVKINLVEPNRNQPRKHFDEDGLAELAQSINHYGILQPLIVTDKGSNYEIIAGERRWRAAKIAGLKEVPVIIRDNAPQEAVEISLIENIQRENLNPIEEAKAYQRLIHEYSLTQDDLSSRVAKSRSAITNSLRLLKLAERVQEMLVNEMISVGHAKVLLAIEDANQQSEIATKVFDQNLSVRDTELLVKKILANKEPKVKQPQQKEMTTEDVIYEDLEKQMTDRFGTKVQIQRKKNNKGKIEIEYYSRDELDRIIELLESISS